jgi:hypothetical protein
MFTYLMTYNLYVIADYERDTAYATSTSTFAYQCIPLAYTGQQVT